MARVLVEENGIQFPANAVTIPIERANRYLVRIAKGLLTHFYPELDYSAHVFKVDHLMPRADDIGMLFERFAYDERGEGMFRFFRGVVSDPPMGMWVFVFYDSACFLVLERMCLLKQLYKGREPFLRNKDIAAQKPLSSTEVQLLPVVSVFGIGVDEK
jgi:hypothetical protein